MLGPVRLTRAFAPVLRGAKGAVINVGPVLSWFTAGTALASE